MVKRAYETTYTYNGSTHLVRFSLFGRYVPPSQECPEEFPTISVDLVGNSQEDIWDSLPADVQGLVIEHCYSEVCDNFWRERNVD